MVFIIFRTGKSTSQGNIADRPVGLRGRCPRCGQGRLFRGFLSLQAACEHCGLDYGFADAGDGPAVFAIPPIGRLHCQLAALFTEISYQAARIGCMPLCGCR